MAQRYLLLVNENRIWGSYTVCAKWDPRLFPLFYRHCTLCCFQIQCRYPVYRLSYNYMVMCLMCFVSYLSTSPRPIFDLHVWILCARSGIFGSWRKTSRSVICESVLMWFQMIYQMVVSCSAETEGQITTQAVWIAYPLSLHWDRRMGRLATLS